MRGPALCAALLLSGCCFPVDAPNEAPTPPPGAPSGEPAGAVDGAGAVAPPGGQLPGGATRGQGSFSPHWSLRPDSRLEERAGKNLVPQLADARTLFTSITDGPSKELVEGGLLVCDLRMPGTPWFRSRPDMRARFHLGKAPVALADGRNNRDAVTLSTPMSALGRGESLRVEVLDRDLFNKDDFLDAAETSFPGHFPLILAGAANKLQATCRHLDASGVAQRLPEARQSAQSAMDGWVEALGESLDARAPDLGYPWPKHEAMETGIDGVAALLGWGGAPVPSLRATRSAELATWNANAQGMVKQLTAAAPEATAVVDLGSASAGPFEVVCGEAPLRAALSGAAGIEDGLPRCALGVTLTGGVASEEGLPGGRKIDLVFPDARTERLQLVVNHAGKAWFSAEGTPSALGRTALQDASLVRIVRGDGVEVVKLP